MLTIKQILEFGSGELPNEDGQIPVWDQTNKRFDLSFNINDYLKDITNENIFDLSDVEYNTEISDGQILKWENGKFIVADESVDGSLWKEIKGTPENTIFPINNENILTEGNITANQFIGDGSNIENVKYSLYNSATGLISGGEMSINSVDNSKFDIAPFTGYVIDQYTDPDNPTNTKVNFPGMTDIEVTNIETQVTTHIAIDKNNNIIQRENIITTEEKRDYIYLGVLIHPDNSIISMVENLPMKIPGLGEKLNDLTNTIGLIKVDNNNRLYPIGENLKFKKTSGYIFRYNANYIENSKDPNIKEIPEYNPVEFKYKTFEGNLSDFTEDIITNEYETIDEFGDSTIHTIENDLYATVQRVYMFDHGEIYIQRGQNVYDTLEKAINTFLIEDFKNPQNIENDALLIGAIATTVHCSDLADMSRCVFFTTDRYGTIKGGGNSGYLSLENDIVINELSDFPDPDENGFINLQDEWTYQINGNVNIAPYKIKMGVGSTLYGINPVRDLLITSVDGALINSENAAGIIKNVGLNNLHPTDGEIFDIVGDGTNLFMCQTIYIMEHTNIGKIENLAWLLFDSIYVIDFKGTLRLVGSDSETIGTPNSIGAMTVLMDKLYILEQSTTGNTFLTIDEGYFTTIKIWDGTIKLSDGNTFLYVDPSQVDLAHGTLQAGLLSNNIFILDIDEADVLSGIDHIQGCWRFSDNLNIQNSNILAYIAFSGNDTETDITTSNEYVKVAGTNDGSSFAERMDITQDDARIDHICIITPKLSLEFTLFGSIQVDGTNQTALIGIFKNGEGPPIVEQSIFCPRPDEPMTFALSTFDTNSHVDDYYEVFVANTNDTNNITVVDMQFKALTI